MQRRLFVSFVESPAPGGGRALHARAKEVVHGKKASIWGIREKSRAVLRR